MKYLEDALNYAKSVSKNDTYQEYLYKAYLKGYESARELNKQELKNDLTTIIYENIDKSVSVGKLLLEINKYLDASTNKENR